MSSENWCAGGAREHGGGKGPKRSRRCYAQALVRIAVNRCHERRKADGYAT